MGKLYDSKHNPLYKYSTKVTNTSKVFYHLSFKGNLEGVWEPKEPDGDYEENTDPDLLPEPRGPRISVSPTIEQCFQAIYASIKHLFVKGKHEELVFNIYSPSLTGDERIITPETLSKNKLIHDAHITEEHCFISDVKMEHIGKVKIKMPNENDKEYYYAYGDKKAKEYYGWLPKNIKYKIERN